MERAAETGRRVMHRMPPERAFAGIIMMLAAAAVLSFSGCDVVKVAVKASEPSEATFADPEKVILRTVEMVTVKAEYWDSEKNKMAVKKWTVLPPAWIINDAAMQLRMRMKKQAKAEGISSATVQDFVNPKGVK